MMKKTFFFLIVSFLPMCVFTQAYRKDVRPQHQKEDMDNEYSGMITQKDILQALEMVGVSIHKFSLKPFDKPYHMAVTIEEYTDGIKTGSKLLFGGENTYTYSLDSTITENSVFYVDYLDRITFFTQENENNIFISFVTYDTNLRNKLELKKTRKGQFYEWRQYSKNEWVINENVPLLVYASSWQDGNIERFCGVTKLSVNDEDTKELLDSSPHYFVISYKISDE